MNNKKDFIENIKDFIENSVKKNFNEEVFSEKLRESVSAYIKEEMI